MSEATREGVQAPEGREGKRGSDPRCVGKGNGSETMGTGSTATLPEHLPTDHIRQTRGKTRTLPDGKPHSPSATWPACAPSGRRSPGSVRQGFHVIPITRSEGHTTRLHFADEDPEAQRGHGLPEVIQPVGAQAAPGPLMSGPRATGCVALPAGHTEGTSRGPK